MKYRIPFISYKSHKQMKEYRAFLQIGKCFLSCVGINWFNFVMTVSYGVNSRVKHESLVVIRTQGRFTD